VGIMDAAGAFVQRHSQLFAAALADDPEAVWVRSLPPAAELPLERCVELLGCLAQLRADSSEPNRVCHARARPLYPALLGCSCAELRDMKHLADYLQLPIELPKRIVEQLAANDAVAAAAVSADGALAPLLRGDAVLRPLLEEFASARFDCRRELFFGRMVRGPAFFGGLCGDECPTTGALSGADLPPAPASAACSTDAVAEHVAARVAAGHPLPSADSVSSASVRAECALPVVVAASDGNLAALTQLHAQGWLASPAACAAAARQGHLEALRWLRRTAGAPVDEGTADAAVAGNQLSCLQFAAEEGCYINQQCLSRACGVAGSAEVVAWILDRFRVHGPADWDYIPIAYSEHAFRQAASVGDIAAMEVLQARGCPRPDDACIEAAAGGHLRALQWLRAQEPPHPWGEEVAGVLAARGDLTALQWVRGQEPPCPWGPETCDAAAESGQEAALRWLRAQEPPCPWGDHTMRYLARSGPLALVQWAVAGGCPYGADAFAAASAAGRADILAWLRQQEPL
jgi:hypothetical protein